MTFINFKTYIFFSSLRWWCILQLLLPWYLSLSLSTYECIWLSFLMARTGQLNWTECSIHKPLRTTWRRNMCPGCLKHIPLTPLVRSRKWQHPTWQNGYQQRGWKSQRQELCITSALEGREWYGVVIKGCGGARLKSDSGESDSESESNLSLGRPQPTDCAYMFLLMYVQKWHTKNLCLN